jgi:hypothetical protein
MLRPAHVYRNQQASRLRRTHRRPVRFKALIFEPTFGSGRDGTRTDKIDLLPHASEVTRVDPRYAIAARDLIGARNNAMTAIGVLSGYGSRNELRGAGCNRLCKMPPRMGRSGQHKAVYANVALPWS